MLLFLLCYMSVVFMCLTWIYSPGNESPETAVHPRVDSEQAQQFVVPSAPIRVPDNNVLGQIGKLDPQCPNVANRTQSTVYQGMDQQHFFLSAYFDERKHPDVYIRILSIHPRAFTETFYCILGGDGDVPVQAVKLQKYPFNENHGKQYGGLILSCLVTDIVDKNPCVVQVSKEPRAMSNMVTLPLLHIPRHSAQYESDFGVCIPPLYGDLPVESLVDFVETTRQLGANHFYFYRFDGDLRTGFVNAAIQTVLQYYADKGLATVYPWRVPVRDTRFIWYNGQVLAIHHCLYQNMWKHKYLLFNDIDELLVPQKHDSWSSLLDELDTGEYSGFQFVSAFFPPDNTKHPTVVHNVLRSNINLVRTKCAVKPERIFEMGIHHISKWNEEPWKPIRIEPGVALLHHYRRCDPFFGQRGFRCTLNVSDDRMLMHKETIEKHYSLAMQEVKGRLQKGS